MTLQSDFYRPVQDNGYSYEVYHPVDPSEQLIQFPDEPEIPVIQKSNFSKDSFLNLDESFNKFDLKNRILQTSSISMVTTRMCKRDCVDSGKTYCPNSLRNGKGICCIAGITCTRSSGEVCSSDVSNIKAKYFACGEKCTSNSSIYSSPPMGVNNYLTIIPTDGKYISLDNVCSWVLSFPSSAFTNDTLTLRVNMIQNAGLNYLISNSFSDSGSNYSIGTGTTGSRIKIYYPQKLYFYIIGNNGEFNFADFNLNFWVIDNPYKPPPTPPPPVIVPPPP